MINNLYEIIIHNIITSTITMRNYLLGREVQLQLPMQLLFQLG